MSALGVSDNSRVVLHSVNYPARAARVWRMLHRLGFTDVAVYAASLDEWAADPANPMELGEESGKYDKD